MSIWKIIILIIAVFILFQISRFVIFPGIDSVITAATHKKETINFRDFKTQKECLENKGEWRRPGPWPKEICQKKMKDSGKTCIAGFQCEAGSCLSRGTLRGDIFFNIGKCPAYTLFFGCIQSVHFGLTSHTICLD